MIDAVGAEAFNEGAAISETRAENEEWLTALEQQTDLDPPLQPLDANTLPRIGIDGPGFLTLRDRGKPVFARAASLHVGADGRLLDDADREVLGFPTGSASTDPQTLRLPSADAVTKRFRRYDIDQTGVVRGVLKTDGRVDATSGEQTVEIGRLCLAVFAAPQHLTPQGEGVALASRLSGPPRYLAAGAAHLGTIRHNPQSPKLDAMQQHMRALWSLTGRSEIDTALSATNDRFTRIAIDLVK